MPIQQENIVRRQTIKETEDRHSGIEHWHHRTELALVMEGSYQIRIGKQQWLCLPGDLAVIRSGQIHAFRNGPGCRIRICTFDPAVFYGILSEPRFPKSYISAQALAEMGLSQTVSGILDELLREKAEQPPLCEALMLTQLLRLYTLLLRHFEDDTPQGQPLSQLQQFQTALEYIENHYSENITLSQVAEQCGYTDYVYFSRRFRQITGLSPRQWKSRA